MLTRYSKPIGIDRVLDRLQLSIHPYIESQLTVTDYKCLPRAYKVYKEGYEVPEINIDGKDYTETLFDDTVSISSFFLVSDDREYTSDQSSLNVDCSLIVQADLDRCYSTSTIKGTRRMDEDLIMLYTSFFTRNVGNEFIMKSIKTGVDNVYRDLRLNDWLDNIRSDDMSNFFVFSIDFGLNYQIKKC